MKAYYDQLGKQTDYNLDAFCDLLGVPENVYFRKVKVVDTATTLLRFEKSALYKLFYDCKAAQKGREICLFAVSGEHTIIITDMQTRYVTGLVHQFYRDADDHDIHIFKAADAPARMPSLFEHKQ